MQTNSTNQTASPEALALAREGETVTASAAMLAAGGGPAVGSRKDWSVAQEDDSSFFVPERCTALDDF